MLELIKQIREPRLDISAYTLERQEGFEPTDQIEPMQNSEDEDYCHDDDEIVYQVSNADEEIQEESS